MFAGDNLGKIPHKGFEAETPFVQRYGNFWSNVKALTKEEQPLQTLNPQAKIIITVCGQSGTGKTTFIGRLMKLLSAKHHPCHISRDACICEVMTGDNKRMNGQEYAEIYSAYNAIKRFHEKEIFFAELKDFLSKQKNLSQRFAHLTNDAVPDVHKEVATKFNKDISDALNDTLTGIIIVDTLMNLWKSEAEKLPSFMEHIQIDVPFANFSSIISQNNGLCEQQQMRLSKSNTLLRPADGDFINRWFNPILQKPDIRKYQAPPVILTDLNDSPCEVGWNHSLRWLLCTIGKSPIIRKYVDANIMNMNGKEFMEHLIKKYKGDLFQVRKVLYEVWDCNMGGILPIGKDMKMSVSLKAKYIFRLVEFTKFLHEHDILEKPLTEEDFESNDKLFWNTLFCIPTLKYKDTFVGEKFWVNKFMLKYRGLNLFIHPLTGEVMDLRFLMDRGAEIHSKITKGKATGQDDGDTNHGINLNKIKEALINDFKLHGFLTQKADGSLGAFTVYTGKTLKIMKAYIETFGTELAKEIARKSLEMSKGKLMIVLATQGTKSITEDMVPFATTSIFGGIYDNGKPLVSRDEFGEKTPLMIWKEHGEKVMERIFSVHASAYAKHKDESITLMFEMVCANRRDAFGGKAHEEFACQSTEDQFLFLGLAYSSEETIPHFVVNTNGAFRQPAFWEIKQASQVNDMIRDLQLVMEKKMSQENFISVFPPCNPDEFEALHPEGFCFWAFVDESTTPLHEAYGLPSILTYSKVKTLIYYFAHKIKEKNISALVEFGACSPGLFPPADILYQIYSSGVLQELLCELHGQFLAMVDITQSDSQLSSIIQEIYGSMQRQSVENITEGIEGEAEDECITENVVPKKKSKFEHPLELYKHLSKVEQKPKMEQKPNTKKESTKPKVEMTTLDMFVHALMNHKNIDPSDKKAIELQRRIEFLFVDHFILSWNQKFHTEIQSLGQIGILKADSVEAPFSQDGRKLFHERVRLAEEARSLLLTEILTMMPWNEKEWFNIASVREIPLLLEVQIIKLMIKLMNMETIYLPTVQAQAELE